MFPRPTTCLDPSFLPSRLDPASRLGLPLHDNDRPSRYTIAMDGSDEMLPSVEHVETVEQGRRAGSREPGRGDGGQDEHEQTGGADEDASPTTPTAAELLRFLNGTSPTPADLVRFLDMSRATRSPRREAIAVATNQAALLMESVTVLRRDYPPWFDPSLEFDENRTSQLPADDDEYEEEEERGRPREREPGCPRTKRFPCALPRAGGSPPCVECWPGLGRRRRGHGAGDEGAGRCRRESGLGCGYDVSKSDGR